MRTLRAFVLLAALAPVFAACSDLVGGDEDGVQGTWVHAEGNGTVYLEINDVAVTAYGSTPAGCFDIRTFTIVDRTGDAYTLQGDGDVTVDVVLRVEGRQLSARKAGSDLAVLYDASDQDLTELDACAGSGPDDPSIVCDSLPAVAVGGTVDGALASTDASDGGYYYDLYGLTLGGGGDVTVRMASVELDAYLSLYDAGGTYIDEDDDGGDGTDAELTATLEAGCYRVQASSWNVRGTGAYTLSVD